MVSRRSVLQFMACLPLAQLAHSFAQGITKRWAIFFASSNSFGGTEMRLLASHQRALYAGNGYWEDIPGVDGPRGAQILVLDSALGQWKVDYNFDERLPNGSPRHLAVGALREISFGTDGLGQALRTSKKLLLASTWDLTGSALVFSKNEADAAWSSFPLTQETSFKDFLPQIRCFGQHHDQTLGIDMVFAGHMPGGIFSGYFDPEVEGQIRWNLIGELSVNAVNDRFPGLEGRLRVSSFAELDNKLYAAVGQQIFERVDGKSPHWQLVYTNPLPGRSETGLRGLTATRYNGKSYLLAAVEGTAARIIRIDPKTGEDETELNLIAFLRRTWGIRITYVIAAYNDMTLVPAKMNESILLFGLMSFVAPSRKPPTSHPLFDVGYGKVESGAWYLARFPDARYELRKIEVSSSHPLVAVRAISVSPFPSDQGALYFAGYDANKCPVHNSAWIARLET